MHRLRYPSVTQRRGDGPKSYLITSWRSRPWANPPLLNRTYDGALTPEEIKIRELL